MHGFGTEKIEDELAGFFPGRRIARLDLDTAKSRKTYENIILGFENLELDILVGTQMVTKGLDFDHVQLVGIIDADQLLNYPDFRAYERSFQLMSQVSGRAGRKDLRGRVIIQTTNIDNYIIQDVIGNNYQHMYKTQLTDREQFCYPPYSKLIQLTVKHKNQALVDDAANFLGDRLRQRFGNRVMGPEYPLINKISNWFQKNILIKIERQSSPSKAKEIINQMIVELTGHPEYKSIVVQPDVDPF
jgi:primosomal protein N' (replication factor Y)